MRKRRVNILLILCLVQIIGGCMLQKDVSSLKFKSKNKSAGIHALYWGVPYNDGKFAHRVDCVMNLDYISSVDIYLPWSIFEPNEGAYAWEYFDQMLEIAKNKRKYISIGLLSANNSPQWIKDISETFNFEHPHPNVTGILQSPIPWDEVYIGKFRNTIEAIAKRYDGNKCIDYIVVNGPSTLFGVETNFPLKPQSLSAEDKEKLRFNLEIYKETWLKMMAIFTDSFKKTQISLALHNDIPLIGTFTQEDITDTIQSLRDEAIKMYGEKRKGEKLTLQLLGLVHGNYRFFIGEYTEQTIVNDYILLVWDVKDQVRIGYEASSVFSRANVNNSEPYEAEYIEHVLRNGISYGAEFIKIKIPDIWDDTKDAPYEPYKLVMEKYGKL